MQIWHNKCKVGREHLVTDRREHAGTEGPVKTWLGVRTICAARVECARIMGRPAGRDQSRHDPWTWTSDVHQRD